MSRDEVRICIRPPITVFAIVALWSVIELAGIKMIVAGTEGDAQDRQPVLALMYGGLYAGVLLAATWWILGARPDRRVVTTITTERREVLIDRVFRQMILVLALANLIGCAIAVDEGFLVLGHTVVAAPVVMLLPILYRQVTGRRIAKHFPQQRAAFDIRGLMLVTFVMAATGAVASITGVFRTETFFVAITFGASFGLVWFTLTGLLMTRIYFWCLASVVMIAVHCAIMVAIGVVGPHRPDETLSVLIPLSVGSYLHGLMYWGVARSADYRLAYR